MTPDQIMAVAQTATDMLRNSSAAPAPAAPPAPVEPTFADDEYLTGAQFRAALAAQRNDSGAMQLAADANLAFVRQQYASDFGKYGTEINGLLAQVPPNLRTIDNLTRVVKMVRSDHVDEIAHERAQQLISTAAPTLRPTGGGSAPAPASREYTLESEKIPQDWKDRAQKAGITENTVAEFCRANDMTPQDFYKQFDTPRNRIVEDVSQRRA